MDWFSMRRPEDEDLPMGFSNAQIDRNVALTQSAFGDLQAAAQAQRDMRADMVRLYEQGLVSQQDLEAEFRNPTLDAVVPASLRRQVMSASPDDVARRAAAAQEATYMMPHPAQQLALAGMHVSDPDKGLRYAQLATERAAGALGPFVRDEVKAFGRDWLRRQQSRPARPAGLLGGS